MGSAAAAGAVEMLRIKKPWPALKLTSNEVKALYGANDCSRLPAALSPDCLIPEATIMRGEIVNCDATVVVLGTYIGNISVARLYIGAAGVIHGHVVVDELFIEGSINQSAQVRHLLKCGANAAIDQLINHVSPAIAENYANSVENYPTIAHETANELRINNDNRVGLVAGRVVCSDTKS